MSSIERSLSLAGVLRMTSRNWDVYRKTWYVNALPPLMEPFLYLIAMGYGLGALIQQDVGGVPYKAFIAPGIIAITMMQTAFFETTYSSYVRMFFQKTWDACLSTPLSADEVLWGEVLWAAVRAAINATLMSVVVAGFGLLSYPTAFALPIIAFIVGLVFGGLGLFVTAKVQVIDQFSYAMFLFITPQFLFSGTFFPLAQLPQGVQYLALAFPLTHATGLARAMALDQRPEWLMVHIAYLLIAAVAFPALAVRACRRRVVT